MPFAIELDLYSENGFECGVDQEYYIYGELLSGLSQYEFDSCDYGILGKSKIDLFSLNLYYDVLNISTESNPALSFFLSYSYGQNGIFGKNITHAYENKILITDDYIEIINNLSLSTFYNKMSVEEASKYDITAQDATNYLYVNLTDFSYIIYNNNYNDNFVTCYLKDGTILNFDIYSINNVILNDTIYPLRIKIIETLKGSINFTWLVNLIKKIYINDKEISFSYTSNLVSKIEYDKSRYIKLEYTTRNYQKYLSNIKYCDVLHPTLTENILKTINYEYNNDNRLSLIYDQLTNQGVKIEYSNDKVSNIKTIINGTDEYSNNKNYECSYLDNANITKITNEIGDEKSYYFDRFGKCYLLLDDKNSYSNNYIPNIIMYNYQLNNKISSTPLKVSEASGIMNTLDVIKNTCFKDFNSANFEWTMTGFNRIEASTSIGINGKSSLRIKNNEINYFSLNQVVSKINKLKGKSINFSGYIRGSGTVEVSLIIDGISYINQFSASNIWKKIKTSNIDVDNNVVSISVCIKIYNNSDVRLCEFNIESSGFTRINYLENGDFDNFYKYWDMHESSSYIYSPTFTSSLGKIIKTSLCLEGGCLNENTFSQNVSISGGSGETLVLSFFSQALVTLSDILVSYIKVNYVSLGNKTYYHNINDNTNLFKYNIQTIITEGIYRSVEIGIIYIGKEEASFACFGLFKEDTNSYYYYNEKNSLTEIASGASITEIERNQNDLVKRYSEKTGEFYEYKYLNNGNIDCINDNNGINIKFEYDSNDYLNKSIINIQNNKCSILEQINDNNGNPTYIKNFDGIIIAMSYDDKERISKRNHSNGLVEHFTYDNKDYQINKKYDLYENLINHDFTYDNKYNLNNINITNGSNYNFNNYNIWGDSLNVYLDGSTNTSFSYLKRGNYYTFLPLSKTYPNGTYYFNYNNRNRLTSVNFNNNQIVNYKYDDNDLLIEKNEDITSLYNYDYKYNYDYIGRLTKLTNNYINITYEYDNLDKVEQKTIKIDNKYLNYNYIYDYEYNEYSIGGYFSRLERLNDNDFLLDGFNLKYSNNTNLDFSRNLLIKDEALNKNLLRFDTINDYIEYDCADINNIRNKIISDRTSFNYNDWLNEFKNTKEIYFFIKVISLQNNNDTIILSFNIDNNKKVKLLYNHNGSINVIFNNELLNISGFRIIKGEWNLIRIGIENIFNEESQLTKNKLYIHFNEYQTSFDITSNKFDINNINNIILGGNNNQFNPFEILYLSIGNNISERNRLTGIYNDAYNYVFGLSVQKSKGVV
ncbi:MAG: hypothetical protein IJS58_02340 [Bacilli bacterium]|nr:hypothetical protein [Bacilli bacterium]